MTMQIKNAIAGPRAHRQFAETVSKLGVGAQYETGLCWTPDRGWNVYQRVYDASGTDQTLMLSPKEARVLADFNDKHSRSPEFSKERQDYAFELSKLLRGLAHEAARNASKGQIPEGGLEFMQPRGNS